MNETLLIDTDILIDYLLSNSQAVDFLENLTQLLLISSITVAEFYAGVGEGKERTVLDNFITIFEVIPIDQKNCHIRRFISAYFTKIISIFEK